MLPLIYIIPSALFMLLSLWSFKIIQARMLQKRNNPEMLLLKSQSSNYREKKEKTQN